jgi:Gp5 N-terminal OB domain
MTERAFGSNFKWFVAKVVNRGDGNSGDKDKTESGRVQIRIYGKHDDEKNIPDSALPWAIPMMPINAGAGRNGVSGTPAGLLKDSQVVGFYADEDENLPILMGVLIRAGKDSSQSNEDGGENVTSENNDVPKGSRTTDTQGSDKNDVVQKGIINEVGQESQLYVGEKFKSVGGIPYDEAGAKVLDAINSVDPENSSGAIPGALSGMKSMLNIGNVAGTLLSNFRALAGGKFSIGSILSLAATAQGIKNYVPNLPTSTPDLITGAADTIRNATLAASGAGFIGSTGLPSTVAGLTGVGGAVTALTPGKALDVAKNLATLNIAQSLTGAAFGGGNPMEAILGGLGGLGGIKSLASAASGITGPLTANFGAASAIAGIKKSVADSVVANIPVPNFPKAPGLQNLTGNIGNISGLVNSLSGQGVVGSILNATPIGNFGFSNLGGVGQLAGTVLNTLGSTAGTLSQLAIQSSIPGGVLGNVAGVNVLNTRNTALSSLTGVGPVGQIINPILSTLNSSDRSLSQLSSQPNLPGGVLNNVGGFNTGSTIQTSSLGLGNVLPTISSPSSLLNSSITFPGSVTPGNINGVYNKNPAVLVGIDVGLPVKIAIPVSYDVSSAVVINDVDFVSPIYGTSTSLYNTSITANIPQSLTSSSIQHTLNSNVGKNYNVHSSVFKVTKTARSKRL